MTITPVHFSSAPTAQPMAPPKASPLDFQFKAFHLMEIQKLISVTPAKFASLPTATQPSAVSTASKSGPR